MELFNGAKVVRLRSHHNKYLVAKADAEHVSQDPSATAVGALWTVQYVGEPCIPLIRFKSCYGRYLTASNDPFLLGITGRKVLQTVLGPLGTRRRPFEWLAIGEGTKVKLMIPHYCRFLRANCGIGPWSGSVTNDIPHFTAFQNWIVWAVEIVPPLPPVPRTLSSSHQMEHPFMGAKQVQLRSHHNTYLVAERDEVGVSQCKNLPLLASLWTIDLALTAPFVRLKSFYDRYLTASDEPFLLGMTGCKVIQTIPARLDSSVEWEPIREGNQFKLKNRNGRFLRANGRVPPWRDSVTTDIPRCVFTKKWVLWDVEILTHRRPNAGNARFSTPGSSTSAAHENPLHPPPPCPPD